MSTHSQPNPAPAPSLTGATVYLAESYEIIVYPGDPSGITNPETEVHGSVVTVGVYSTVANAEAALDARIARMAHMAPLGQFEPNGIGSACGFLRYLSPVPGCDDQQWQQILPVTIDTKP